MTTPALSARSPGASEIRAAAVALLLALVAAISAYLLKPTTFYADRYPMPQIAIVVPERFGDWQWDRSADQAITSAQGNTLVNQIYSQVVARTYSNGRGDHIMLSIAYGPDQREGLQVHKPEFCYAAQGFALGVDERTNIAVLGRTLPVTRFVARAGRRIEPITYWRTLGASVVTDGLNRRLNELRYATKGLVADGLVFRVSSIDDDRQRAYAVQDAFVAQLLESVDRTTAIRLAGLAPQSAAAQ